MLSPDARRILDQDVKHLRELLIDCRPDMHEPDEQGIQCSVTGDHLDNASNRQDGGGSEFTVRLVNKYDEQRYFNLANLIALARMACYTED